MATNLLRKLPLVFICFTLGLLVSIDNCYSTTGPTGLTDANDASEPCAVITTAKALGEKFSIMELTGTDIRFEGLKEEYAPRRRDYTITDTTIKIYGSVEAFSAIEQKLTSVDFSKALELSSLDVAENELSEVILPKTSELREVNVERNKLTSLDCSGLPSLTMLFCGHNELSQLNVKGSESTLLLLRCDYNKLQSLRLANFSMLSILSCHHNQLSELTVEGCSKLAQVRMDVNRMSEKAAGEFLKSLPTIPEIQVGSELIFVDTTLPEELNEALKKDVQIALDKNWDIKDNNGRTEDNDNEVVDYEGLLPALIRMTTAAEKGKWIYFSMDADGEIEISGLKGEWKNGEKCNYKVLGPNIVIRGEAKIYTLYANNCEIQRLDLAGVGDAMHTLEAKANQIDTLDLTNNKGLQYVWLGSNPISDINIQGLPMLHSLYLDHSQLTSLVTKDNPALDLIHCEESILESIDLSGAPNLTDLNCRNNKIKTLDASNLSKLVMLDAGNNRISEVNVGNCLQLETLYLSGNLLTHLSVQNLPKLQDLQVDRNQLLSLNVEGANRLMSIYMDQNNIEGEEMINFVRQICVYPNVEGGEITIVDMTQDEGNKIFEKEVNILTKQKGWRVYDYNGSYNKRKEYKGISDTSVQDVGHIRCLYVMLDPQAAQIAVSGVEKNSMIMLFNLNGEKILEVQANGNGDALMHIGDLQRGVYIVSTSEGAERVILR